MTSVKKDIERVTQPLLDRHSDLVRIGRMIVIKPVHHVLRFFYIDRSSQKGSFSPYWSTSLLCRSWANLSFEWGGRIPIETYGPWPLDNRLIGVWNTAYEKAWYTLLHSIEGTVSSHSYLDELRQIETIDDFVAHANGDQFLLSRFRDKPLMVVFSDAATGRFSEAIEKIEKIMNMKEATINSYSVDIYNNLTQVLYPLLQTEDRTGIAALLRKYEYNAVKYLKLTDLWEPTPFPIELQK